MSRLVIAGLAVAGTSLLAMVPAPDGGPDVQHRAVKLAAGELDWTAVVAETESNLTALQTDAAKGSTDLSTALGNLSENFSTRISDALSGFDSGIQNALYGGWYGGDDGYVFGLFGGTVDGPDGPMTNSLIGLLTADFQAGNAEQAYSDLNAFELELTDHTLNPLLSPFVDETDDAGNTTYGIPAELSQIQTNLLHTFANYNELKDGLQSVLSPEITAQLILTRDLDAISTDFTAGNTTQGLSDLNNLSSDVFGAFINGADVGTNPVDNMPQFFAGLLSVSTDGSSGGLLDHLLLTWPEQIVMDLGTLADPVTSGTAEAVGSSAPDLFSGLLGF